MKNETRSTVSNVDALEIAAQSMLMLLIVAAVVLLSVNGFLASLNPSSVYFKHERLNRAEDATCSTWVG
jgi:hypothetical protein